MEKFTIGQYLAECDKNLIQKSQYRKRYEAMKRRITSKWYILQSNKHMIVSIKVPSERTRNLSYDVIFEFEATNKDTSRKLKTAEMKVFSNCPSFVFANAAYFKSKSWLLDWALSLYDDKVFNQEEKSDGSKSQPRDRVSIEKSLYFACMYLHDLNSISVLQEMNRALPAFSTNQVLISVKDSNKMLDKRIRKVKIDKKFDKLANEVKRSTGIGKTKSIGKIGSSGKTKSISKVKHI